MEVELDHLNDHFGNNVVIIVLYMSVFRTVQLNYTSPLICTSMVNISTKSYRSHPMRNRFEHHVCK